MPRPKLIFITGPTAVGKSGLGHQLAREMGGEILNADSLQVFRDMDIGTAKPSLSEQREVPHHLIDILNPDQLFNVSEFRIRAQSVIEKLHLRRVPILVIGGTGLYLRVLQRGIFPCPEPKPEIRKRWQQAASDQGPEFLWSALKEIDPKAAERIHPRDTFRLIRALEVPELTGRPISEWQQWRPEAESDFDILWIGLFLEREALYRRINLRTEEMMTRGFLAEVEGLLAKGYSPELKPMQSLGYRHLTRVINGDLDLEEALGLLKRDTRRYAKRQMTWLSKEASLNWLSPQEFDKIRFTIHQFLDKS
ncbi:MAG: tRNA (adenosine(37)-N6)-dimethylallyltransferase MiaA [Deltaproteobacteria bacterium]|nr:tRNA (adenosine(37)-N6)-dimethylallyltransferase MiaA [Deltaproteobacteria bacterium]